MTIVRDAIARMAGNVIADVANGFTIIFLRIAVRRPITARQGSVNEVSVKNEIKISLSVQAYFLISKRPLCCKDVLTLRSDEISIGTAV